MQQAHPAPFRQHRVKPAIALKTSLPATDHKRANARVPGRMWGASVGAEERRLGGRVRSTLRPHSRLGCLSAESVSERSEFRGGPPSRAPQGSRTRSADRRLRTPNAAWHSGGLQASAAFTAADTCAISALPASCALAAPMTLPMSAAPGLWPSSAVSASTMALTCAATSSALRRCGR